MYNDIIKSKLGLVIIIAIATIVSFNGTKVDENILKNNIGTPAILITEGTIVLLSVLLTTLFIPKMRTKLISDLKRMNVGNIIRLGGYAIFGMIIAFMANDALLEHGTNEVKMYKLIIGLLVTGGIYFMTADQKITIKKLLFFITLSIFAILFSLE